MDTRLPKVLREVFGHEVPTWNLAMWVGLAEYHVLPLHHHLDQGGVIDIILLISKISFLFSESNFSKSHSVFISKILLFPPL